VSAPDISDLDRIIAARANEEGALLPLLHDIVHAFGHVPAGAVEALAAALNLSRADVHGVVSFYADFRTEPPARRTIQLCVAEACQARGVAAAKDRLEAASGLKLGETRADGSLALEPIYCLGLCASGPAAMVDGAPRAGLSGARLEALISETVR
jgi:formate dehydrogenase subunit gamma